MFINRLSMLLLSLTLGLAACQSQAPVPQGSESERITYGARAVEPRFSVVEAPDGVLEVDAITDKATAEVYYPMKPRDKVRVQWQGSQTHSTAVQAVAIARVLKFDLPKQWIEESVGQTVTLTYWYQTAGAGPEVSSAPLTLRVVGGAVDPVFKVLEAKTDGTLDADTLGPSATVQVLRDRMEPGDTLRVTWSGVPSHNTEIKRVLDRAIPVEFAVPKAWVTENIGRTVPVLYTYEQPEVGTPVPSRPIQVRVTSNIVENGRVIAARLDARYNNTSNDCSGEPAFFCNGVMLRTVDSGNFLSWNPSANSIKKGAVSFSFLRRDMGIQKLAWDAVQGIIFKNVERTLADGNLNVRILCSFPSDAATDVRANQGCGAHPSYPTQSVYCSTLGISTLAQWKQHYESAPAGWQRNQHQCSFYAPSRSAFAVSLVARSNFQTPATDRQYHNEIMLQLWGQNLHRQVPLEALFYRIQRNPASGLASVKVIQRDYFNCTGSVLPIMRLTLADGAASAFSFVAADQGVAATDVANQAACRAKESK